MPDRREFLTKTTALAATSSALGRLVHAGCQGAQPADKTRDSMRMKPRRIIWNNDGDDLWIVANGYPAPDWPNQYGSPQEYLARRTAAVKGTQVDCISYCGFAVVPNWEFPSDNTKLLGPDPLKHVVDFAHGNEMEFIYSLRMNDVHCAVYPGEYRWSPFKRKNLRLLQANISREEFEHRIWPWVRGEIDEHPLHHLLDYWGRKEGRLIDQFRNSSLGPLAFSWPAFDFAHAEVRAHYLQIIDQACRRYDLDGIELDWGRHPLVFKFGQERRYVPVMNDFIHRVRQVLDERGKRRGRPILLATRVPDVRELALHVGLDVATWVEKGWLDLLIAGFGSPFSMPIGDWVRLGHNHGIAVYGGLSWLPLFENIEAIRAAAYRFWEAGVDGVYLFNLLRPERFDCLDEIGDPELLARRNKLYQVDPDRRYVGYMNLSRMAGQLPLEFTPEAGPATMKLQLSIADQPEGASRVTVQTLWNNPDNGQRREWRLNGRPLTDPRRFRSEHRDWTGFDTQALKNGANILEVTVHPLEAGLVPEPLVLEQVRVSIAYS